MWANEEDEKHMANIGCADSHGQIHALGSNIKDAFKIFNSDLEKLDFSIAGQN